MSIREAVTVVGLLLALTTATVLPFAIPMLRMETGERAPVPTPTPHTDDSSPVAPPDSHTPTEPAPATPTDERTPTPAGNRKIATPSKITLSPPEVPCGSHLAEKASTTRSFPGTNRTVTGENVTVAVVDASGFDVEDPRIADNVVATESFWSRDALDITNGGYNRHGTESAAIVSRIAPDAKLYLANFQTAHDFTEAVDWAIEQDVDVLVAPVTFYAKPNDGTAPVSRAVTRATENGIPVVVPSGNVATQHWEGTYRNGPWLAFDGNDTRLNLRGSTRPVQVWLWWNRSDDAKRHDFRIVLTKDTGDKSKRIATSRDYPKGPVGANQVLWEQIRTNNLLSESIANGTYDIRVRGPPDAVHRVEIVAANHRLDAPVKRGSLMAPATASGSVIVVGAAREGTRRPLDSSSRGPTNDGRPGLDVLARGRIGGANGATFTGTSTAASYTGGIVALLKGVDPSLTPSQTEAIVQATASPPATGERPLATGYGIVDPADALACAEAMSNAKEG